MDEDVPSANFAQEDALCGVVEEAGVVPGDVTVAVEDEAEDVMLDERKATKKQPTKQPIQQPTKQPNKQPIQQPKKQHKRQHKKGTTSSPKIIAFFADSRIP